MNKICIYIYTKGQDVICSKTKEILGDIIGYSGFTCVNCTYKKERVTKSNKNEVKI